MKPRDYIISQIQHRETHPVPYTFKFEESVAQKIDEHYGSREWRKNANPYMDNCLTASTIQEVKINDVYVRDGYGGLWRIDRRPWHLEKPPLAERTFAGYDFPQAAQFTDPIHRDKEAALNKIKENKDRFHIITMGWGLFEQSWRLRGFENALMDTIEEPDFYSEMICRIADIYIEMVKACADIPADAFMFGDDWGDQRGVIIGPDRWRELIKPHWKRIYAEVHKQGKYVISHSCGSIVDILDDAIEIGLDVYESVQPEARGMNPFVLKEKFGSRITFWGCLGSQSTIPFGTPDELRKLIKQLCTVVGKEGGYIISPAKPLQPETPVENAVAIYESFVNQ